MILAALCVFIAVIVAALVYSHVAAHKLRSADWQSLAASIEPIHARGLEMVALDHMQPQANQLRLEPDEIWDLVGGIQGLKRMRRNANRMIALAAYVQRWNFNESIIIAERIRQCDNNSLWSDLAQRKISVVGNIHIAALVRGQSPGIAEMGIVADAVFAAGISG